MVDATSSRIGSTLLGVWQVVRDIGAGGMGSVCEVQHVITKQRRAMKIMHANRSADASAVSRLLREAAVTQSVKSSHVVRTESVGVLDDGSPYLMMELLEGRSLAERLKAEKRLPIAEVVRLADEIAQGLAAAHAARLVHRDMTPRNVFLVRVDGVEHAKIVDFGLSKHVAGMTDRFGHLTGTGAFVGTPYYVSPEQAGGHRVDARADQYGLAVILYECLSGTRPYDGDSLIQVLGKIACGEHVALTTLRPEIPPQMSRAVARAMSLDPEQRYEDVIAFSRALASGSGELSVLDESYANTAPVRVIAVLPDAGLGFEATAPRPAPELAPVRSRNPTLPVATVTPKPERRIGGFILLFLGLGLMALVVAFAATAYVIVLSDTEVRAVPRRETPPRQSQPELQLLYLQEMSDSGDYAGCVIRARGVAATPAILAVAIECARLGGRPEDGRWACRELMLVASTHPGVPYCIGLLSP